MAKRFVAAVLLLLSVTACAARTPTAPARPSAERARVSPAEQLRADLDAIFTARPLEHALWGIKFESLRTGATLYSFDANKLLLPASNQKLLSAAVAAERLGWDYRFTTRVHATGPIDGSGTLRGDLVVVGNGDPTINPRHGDRARLFEQWAVALERHGIRAVDGRIIGNDDAFSEPGLGQGWTWENLPYGFGTAIGALQFNENQFVVNVTPGAEGAKPEIATAPTFHGMVIANEARTVAAGAQATIDIARLPGSNVLRVIGEIAADAKATNITASVENPTEFYARALRAALIHKGIDVRGDAVDIDDLAPHTELAGVPLIVDNSPPLREVIDVCLKWSRNEYAETLLRSLAPSLPANASDALTAMRSQLSSWGIPPSFLVPVDGSGLSRQDYVTAHGLNLLLIYTWRNPALADTFRASLPVAGVSGTLAERMKGTLLEGRVLAKTGTLSNVRSLSGYLFTRSGEPIVFSMLSNNFQVATDDIDAAMEAALSRVFDFSSSH